MNSIFHLLFLSLMSSAQGEQSLDIVPAPEIIPMVIPGMENEKTDAPAQKVTDTKPESDLKKEASEIKKVEAESHWGLALGGAWIHDYPGSQDGRFHYMALPSYKGKYITIDRQDGVKGDLVNENRIKFSFSFIFLFPAESEKIPARQGMPDLDWTFQLGPELQIYLMRSFYHTMYFRMPLRFIATTDFYHDFTYREWNLAPGLRNVFYLGKGWGEITTRLDFDVASEGYNDLFHQVDPRYATPTRPAYNARAGLMEYIVGINYSYYDSFPWTYFIGWNGYSTAVSVNRDSPLIKRDFNFSIIGGVIRYF